MRNLSIGLLLLVALWLLALLVRKHVSRTATDLTIDGEVPMPDGRTTRRGYSYRSGMETMDYGLQARGAKFRDLEVSRVSEARRRSERARISSGERIEFPRAARREEDA